MKRKKGSTITKEQAAWMETLRRNGYAVACCYGWEPAAKFLLDYLNQE